jgi:hypothetical protein
MKCIKNWRREAIYIKCNIKAHSQNHCCCGKQWVLHISVCVRACGCVCVCACVHACTFSLTYTACTVLSSVASLAPPHFSTLSHKWHNLKKKSYWILTVCFDFLYNFYLNISHSKKNSARYKCENIFMESTRYSYQIWAKLEFSRHIFEKGSNIKRSI